jgi:hypothetical protein
MASNVGTINEYGQVVGMTIGVGILNTRTKPSLVQLNSSEILHDLI